MKDNIYDIVISELILRAESSNITAGPQLKLTSTLGTTTLQAGFNGTAVFTSTLTNIPLGYSVAGNSHVISYPIAVPDTTGSGYVLSGASVAVIMGAIASTYVVTSTVTLEHDTLDDIVLTATLTITATSSIFYGVKAAGTLNTNSLIATYAGALTFSLTSTGVGRIWVVLPAGQGPLISVTDPSGLILPVATNFTVTTGVGGYDYYVSTTDTQLTGTNVKTFTLNY